MKKAAFLIVLGVLVVAYPATAGAASFKGIVVAKQASRNALVVASRAGVVRTVRTRSLRTAVGARVAVAARRLHDGTFRASSVRARGHARHARVRAVFARRLRGRYLVSAGSSMFAIRTARRLASAGDSQPGLQPGDVIDATVTITNDGELDENEVDEVGHTDSMNLEGKVISVTGNPPTSITIQPEHGAPIVVTVPGGFTLPALKPGDKVELKVTVNPDGTFTLVKPTSEDDEDDQGEDNDDQGDEGGDDGGGDS